MTRAPACRRRLAQGAALALAAVLVALPAAVDAQGWSTRERPESRDARGGSDAAAAAARRATGGRVLDVRPGNGSYRVRVLTPEGVVRSLEVDRQGRVRR
jgi:hypothetical protein